MADPFAGIAGILAQSQQNILAQNPYLQGAGAVGTAKGMNTNVDIGNAFGALAKGLLAGYGLADARQQNQQMSSDFVNALQQPNAIQAISQDPRFAQVAPDLAIAQMSANRVSPEDKVKLAVGLSEAKTPQARAALLHFATKSGILPPDFEDPLQGQGQTQPDVNSVLSPLGQKGQKIRDALLNGGVDPTKVDAVAEKELERGTNAENEQRKLLKEEDAYKAMNETAPLFKSALNLFNQNTTESDIPFMETIAKGFNNPTAVVRQGILDASFEHAPSEVQRLVGSVQGTIGKARVPVEVRAQLLKYLAQQTGERQGLYNDIAQNYGAAAARAGGDAKNVPIYPVLDPSSYSKAADRAVALQTMTPDQIAAEIAKRSGAQ